MRRSRLTQRDVARHAGVSQAAVSYVLNGTNIHSVSDDTRQRVMRAIDELGYVPDGVARGMRTGRSMLIGAVIPDITNPFYPAFQRGMQDIIESAGYSLVSFNSDGARDREHASIRTALQCRVDGLILSLFETSLVELQHLVARNIPIVLYGTMANDPGDLPFDLIDIDIQQAIQEVVRYLHDQGHRSIAVVDGSVLPARANPRLEAFRDAMHSLGLPFHEYHLLRTEFTELGGYSALRQLLASSPRPSAVIAGNDVIAMGMLTAAEEVGIRVPDDLAIVGYDDIPFARLMRPALTTVALQPERIGACAARMLLDRLTGAYTAETRVELLPHQLIIRNSG